ncbi:MAG: transketolase C-terminal domain-containing protein [Microthrixaceae bacterium]
MSRQNLPVLAATSYEGVAKGAYVLRDADDPELVIVGTGSEVSLALDAAAALEDDGIAVRVVSMPCWERFEAAGGEYQESILPDGIPTLAVEAAVSFGWRRWADDVVSIDRFGASAPGAVVMAELGMTPDHVVSRANDLLGRS